MPKNEKINAILIVGSGTAENVIQTDNGIQPGNKYLVDRFELYGGSGLNHTFRLAATGHPVFPVLSMGRDGIGRQVQKEIASLVARNGKNKQVLDFVEEDGFLCEGLATPQSTILLTKDERTIFSEKIKGIRHFKEFALGRIDRVVKRPEIRIQAVMIGHLYCDNPKAAPRGGELTKAIIRKFKGKSILYANFGSSQFGMGAKFWEDHLSPIDLFQLTLTEVRSFFKNDRSVKSLVDIIHWFRERKLTAVITLDKFGAIAIYKDGRDGLIFGWPFELRKLVDSTGAGDAFGAGLMAALFRKNRFEFVDLIEAIKNARMWAAYACGGLGGANNCPDNATLKKFGARLETKEFHPVEVKSIANSDQIIRLLDKAY